MAGPSIPVQIAKRLYGNNPILVKKKMMFALHEKRGWKYNIYGGARVSTLGKQDLACGESIDEAREDRQGRPDRRRCERD
jgi:hypothetical protein